MDFVANIFQFLLSLFVDKIWEQAKLEDTVDDADPALVSLEVYDPAAADAELLDRFNFMLDSDPGALRQSDQVA